MNLTTFVKYLNKTNFLLAGLFLILFCVFVASDAPKGVKAAFMNSSYNGSIPASVNYESTASTPASNCSQWASSVVSFSQGPAQDGGPVRSNRSNPQAAVGSLEEQNAQVYYVSLGYSGEIVLRFNKPIHNGPGTDVIAYEASSQGHPLEKAQVYASENGSSWTLLGAATNNAGGAQGDHRIASGFDLGSLSSANYIKVKDISDISLFVDQTKPDAYDLSAVEAVQCAPAPSPSATPLATPVTQCPVNHIKKIKDSTVVCVAQNQNQNQNQEQNNNQIQNVNSISNATGGSSSSTSSESSSSNVTLTINF